MTEEEQAKFIEATAYLLGGGKVRYSNYTDDWFMIFYRTTSSGVIVDYSLSFSGQSENECRTNFIRWKVPGFKFPWE